MSALWWLYGYLNSIECVYWAQHSYNVGIKIISTKKLNTSFAVIMKVDLTLEMDWIEWLSVQM